MKLYNWIVVAQNTNRQFVQIIIKHFNNIQMDIRHSNMNMNFNWTSDYQNKQKRKTTTKKKK